MLIDRKKLYKLLTEYLNVIGEGLIGAILVDNEGLNIAAESRVDEIDEEIVGAVSSLIEPILKRFTQEFSTMNFGSGTFETEKFRLIFSQIGELGILVSVLSPTVKIDPILPYTYLISEKLARIFGEDQVSPALPRIKKEDPKITDSNELSSVPSTPSHEVEMDLKEDVEKIKEKKDFQTKSIPMDDNIEKKTQEIISKLPPLEEIISKTPDESSKRISEHINVFFISTVGPGEKKEQLFIEINKKVSGVKDKLGKMFGLDASSFQLSYQGTTLDDETSLLDNDIKDKDEVFILPSSTAGY